MNSLFIDTHDEEITVSFILGSEIFTKSILSESHSTHLLPLIDEMLKEKNIKLTDFNRVIVINGPGSFTGIRIGLTVAKTIAYSLNLDVYVLSSLKAYLLSSDIDNKMCVIEDTKGYYIGTDSIETYDYSLDNYKNYNVIENKLDIAKIIDYINTIKPVNVHGIKANYIKVIEALK